MSVLRPYAAHMLFTAVVPPLGLIRHAQEEGVLGATEGDKLQRAEEKKEKIEEDKKKMKEVKESVQKKTLGSNEDAKDDDPKDENDDMSMTEEEKSAAYGEEKEEEENKDTEEEEDDEEEKDKELFQEAYESTAEWEQHMGFSTHLSPPQGGGTS